VCSERDDGPLAAQRVAGVEPAAVHTGRRLGRRLLAQRNNEGGRPAIPANRRRVWPRKLRAC
jgi:hypothetical protein